MRPRTDRIPEELRKTATQGDRPHRADPAAATRRSVVGPVVGAGFLDLAPGLLAVADAGSGGVLAGLERLVDLEEVLDLGHQLRGQVADVLDVGPPRLAGRDADQLGVLALLVLH